MKPQKRHFRLTRNRSIVRYYISCVVGVYANEFNAMGWFSKGFTTFNQFSLNIGDDHC